MTDDIRGREPRPESAAAAAPEPSAEGAGPNGPPKRPPEARSDDGGAPEKASRSSRRRRRRGKSGGRDQAGAAPKAPADSAPRSAAASTDRIADGGHSPDARSARDRRRSREDEEAACEGTSQAASSGGRSRGGGGRRRNAASGAAGADAASAAEASGNTGAPARKRGATRRHRGPVYAALDLGTNNCRLLVARADGEGFQILDAFSRVVRLGEGLSDTGRLSHAAIDRSVAALSICADRVAKHHGARLRAIATEACRRADNQTEFLDRVAAATGIALEVIDAEQEARLAVAGCAPLLDPKADELLVFDIGGGSTELIWVDLSRTSPERRRALLMALAHGDRRDEIGRAHV